MKKACFYMRTSAKGNLDGDSEVRQSTAIQAFAKNFGYELVMGAYDEVVSGADYVEFRPGMISLIEYCEKHDVEYIICEDAKRFARGVIGQEMGHKYLQERGITIIPTDAPQHFTSDDDPTVVLIRQIMGAFAEHERAMTVMRLKVARERKKKATGKCEGKKNMKELHGPEIDKQARRLRKQGLTYEQVAQKLHDLGFYQQSGEALTRKQAWRLCNRRR